MRSRFVPFLLVLHMAALVVVMVARWNGGQESNRLPASFKGWETADFLTPHGKFAD